MSFLFLSTTSVCSGRHAIPAYIFPIELVQCILFLGSDWNNEFGRLISFSKVETGRQKYGNVQRVLSLLSVQEDRPGYR
jgi:hypothetical protein